MAEHRADGPADLPGHPPDRSTEASRHGRWQPWYTAAHQLRATLRRLFHRR
ncbi:hypothetical protein [Kitasatospora sp. NBC_01539]|uniref:hypothetical protein n=1 Tax=Kitasatospora sp. NBC_01539 TaxID=2903577 RepID=UPI003860311D